MLEPEVKSPAPKMVVFADDVKVSSDEDDVEDEEEDSQVLVESYPDRSLEDIRPQTPSVASDQMDDSEGSESEDYEAEEEGLGEDLDS